MAIQQQSQGTSEQSEPQFFFVLEARADDLVIATTGEAHAEFNYFK